MASKKSSRGSRNRPPRNPPPPPPEDDPLFPFPLFDDTALLVIDVQERLMPVMPPRVADNVVQNIDLLIELILDIGGQVIYTEQHPRGLGHTVEPLRSRLKGCQRIEKISFSCVEEPRFVEEVMPHLSNEVIVVGVETHICVLQSVFDLLLPEDEDQDERTLFVPVDAVCSRHKHHWRNALDQMYDAGASLTNAETLVFQALGDAKHERFKHYSKRIKALDRLKAEG